MAASISSGVRPSAPVAAAAPNRADVENLCADPHCPADGFAVHHDYILAPVVVR